MLLPSPLRPSARPTPCTNKTHTSTAQRTAPRTAQRTAAGWQGCQLPEALAATVPWGLQHIAAQVCTFSAPALLTATDTCLLLQSRCSWHRPSSYPCQASEGQLDTVLPNHTAQLCCLVYTCTAQLYSSDCFSARTVVDPTCVCVVDRGMPR